MGSRVNPFPVDTIHGAFVAAANAHPDAIAVLGNDDDGTPNLSFRQLVNLCRRPRRASHADIELDARTMRPGDLPSR